MVKKQKTWKPTKEYYLLTKINRLIDKKPDGNYYCEVCGRGSRLKRNIIKHIKKRHKSKIK